MAQMDVFQSMWGMEKILPDGSEWTLETKFKRIAEAGFKGVSFDLPYHSFETVKQALPYLNEYDLDVVFNPFVSSTEDYQNVLKQISSFNRPIRFCGLIGQIEPWHLDRVVEQTHEWLDAGKAAGIPTHVEVHRSCMTNDFLFTLQLMEKVPELKMIADLSHVLVNQEWYLPLSERASELVTRFLKRTEAIHGRVGTREQAQVASGFKQHEPWFQQFQDWWQEGFLLWQRRQSNKAARCVFLCELGPPPYAITGADGKELSTRWEEALALKATAEKLWREAEKQADKTLLKYIKG
ncbi:MAG: hypothetical protein KTR17_11045 [Cellvibrionaceae bacterium]|nr:hypothetical protein [Cellvibrionaceae bacterium]